MKAHGAEELIDLCVLRDRDNTGEFSEEADGDLETRLYYCQNWRADVVATIGPDDDATGNGLRVHERVKYDSYGRPRLYPIADYDHDGDVDGSDYSTFMAEHGGAGSAQADINFDSGVDTDDAAIYDDVSGKDSATDNRKLYAGYEWDPALQEGTSGAGIYHVRNRVLLPELGRWSRRDPLGYVDGMSLAEYVLSCPMLLKDFDGQSCLYDCGVCLAALVAAGASCPGVVAACATFTPACGIAIAACMISIDRYFGKCNRCVACLRTPTPAPAPGAPAPGTDEPPVRSTPSPRPDDPNWYTPCGFSMKPFTEPEDWHLPDCGCATLWKQNSQQCISKCPRSSGGAIQDACLEEARRSWAACKSRCDDLRQNHPGLIPQ